jgi:pyruvate kinase
VALADSAGATALIAMTRTGTTARLLAAMRPNGRILAVTPSPQTAAALALVWGVTPVITEQRAIRSVRTTLAERGIVKGGDVIVFVSVHPSLGHENINFAHVERV